MSFEPTQTVRACPIDDNDSEWLRSIVLAKDRTTIERLFNEAQEQLTVLPRTTEKFGFWLAYRLTRFGNQVVNWKELPQNLKDSDILKTSVDANLASLVVMIAKTPRFIPDFETAIIWYERLVVTWEQELGEPFTPRFIKACHDYFMSHIRATALNDRKTEIQKLEKLSTSLLVTSSEDLKHHSFWKQQFKTD